MKRSKIVPGVIVFLTVAMMTAAINVGLVEAGTKPGWQKISHEKYALEIPGTWKEVADKDIWAPKEEILNMARPKTSLHVGAVPPMPGKNRDELLAFYYGSVPKIAGDVKRCGMEGFFVEIDARGYKHHGLILVEKIGPMQMLHFFDCQSPSADFGKNEELFKQILNSVTCN
ncbi:MAG: hypothetical protein MJA29_04440 [Candidatus Omnitrophica bacterium]|nr:hypothetical protein [Candidatus Omnitrophota bacterium]